MVKNHCIGILGILLILISLPIRGSALQEVVIISSQVGECQLTVEADDQWHTLRLRALHPQYKGCQIDKESMLSFLRAAFSKKTPPKLEGIYSSLFIGRLIDYPWLCQYLAITAYEERGWDPRKGRPKATDINKFVSDLLSREELIKQIKPAFAESGYIIAGVSVEKVLVGTLGDVPGYRGKILPGRVPYDAQVWFRLEQGSFQQ